MLLKGLDTYDTGRKLQGRQLSVPFCLVFCTPSPIRKKMIHFKRKEFAHKDQIFYHYENTPIQIYRKFQLQKLKIFR